MEKDVLQEAVTSDPKGAPTRIILTGVRSAFIGPNLTFDTYRTAVATIIVGLDAHITTTTLEEEEITKPGSISVIPPGALCQLKTEGNIARVVAAIGREPENFPTVESTAELAGLSPMRFQHVFTETIGMPFRITPSVDRLSISSRTNFAPTFIVAF